VVTKIKPSIVCIGSNLESKSALHALIAKSANIVAVVTRFTGNSGGVSDYVDLHPLCDQHGIETIDSLDVNSSATLDRMETLQPDYIFTLGTSQLFGGSLLAIPKHFVVGSHPSLLPAGRGRAPVPWTILQGLTSSAVSFFRMAVKADEGDILLQRKFDIPNNSYAIDVYTLVADNLAAGFCEIYAQIAQSTVEFIPQDSEAYSYRCKRTPADGLIDFRASAAIIETLIRAVSYPYPGAYFYYQSKKVEVWRAALEGIPNYEGTPGQILLKRGNNLLVQTGDGGIWLSEFSNSGELLPITEFRIGDRLNFRVQDEIYTIKRELAELRKRLDI
jgi:methionyl-tRNA formyltransferase